MRDQPMRVPLVSALDRTVTYAFDSLVGDNKHDCEQNKDKVGCF